MRRPLSFFVLFVAAYLAVIGWGWFHQMGTAGELLGHAAKFKAILELLRSRDYAWFPDYLSGSPSATLLSFVLAVIVYAPALLLVPSSAIAMKLTALLLLGLGGFAAFAFGRRLTKDDWSGFAVGCAYLLAPQLLLRAGWLEHMTILVAVPLVPLAFLAMLRVAERGTPFDALLLAVALSATFLAWSKMGATLLIPMAMFAGWLFASRSECRLNLLRGAVWAIPATILLGIFPLLPLLRERGFMTVFELDPFAGWQRVYSIKTATSWFDRAGALFAPLPERLRMDHGGYYLGFLGITAVVWTLFATWKNPRVRREIALLRLFLLITLAMFWISLGPRNVLQGHFEFLAAAENLPDFVIPLHWLALAAQGVFLYWCVPLGRWRTSAFILLFGFYLLVPAFRVLEWLPVYGDLRAPDSFWILNGTFAWSIASALAVVFVLRTVPSRFRALATIISLIAACMDFSTYFRGFYRHDLDDKIFADFSAACDHLRTASGRVLPISSRYFYLSIPALTGRPLSNEALNHYLMPRDTARLQAAARSSTTSMGTYLRLAGVGNVWLDSLDKEVSQGSLSWFRSLLPVAFENHSFAILSSPNPLYPGYFAGAVTPASNHLDEYADALESAKEGRLSIANPNDQLLPRTLPGMQSNAPRGFLSLDTTSTRSASHISFSVPKRPGWIALSESWHPDWTATVDGTPTRVYRGGGGQPAVPVQAENQLVEFRFRPPSWYAGCLVIGALTWLIAFLFLGTVRLWPLSLRRRLFEKKGVPVPFTYSATRPLICRPIVLIPTFNEADNINELLERVLASRPDIHALVIDDHSFDGTAARVRAFPAFGERIHLLERPNKQGLGSAYRDGFRWAIDRNYDACIEMDADLSHDPADIPRLIDTLNSGTDVAIGSRYLGGTRVVNWPRYRLWLSTAASRYVHLLTDLPITDATSGFKALRIPALRQIDWKHLRTDGYGFQVELHWLLWKAGVRLVEVPIIFTERRTGQTKMTTGIAVQAAWRVLQLAVMDSPKMCKA